VLVPSDVRHLLTVSIIEEIGTTRPGAANLTLKVMRRLFAYAIKRDMPADNPFAGFETYKLGTYHTWTEAEIAAYEAVWPIGTRQRLAFDLLLYTGQRVGDVAAWRRSDVRNGEIHFVQEKTGAGLVIPVHSNLVMSMKAYSTKGLALFGQENGRPISGDGLSAVVERGARAAGLPAKCVPHFAEGADAALGRARRDHQADCVGIRSQDAKGSGALHGSSRPSTVSTRHYRTKQH
jgi:integrase